LVAEQVKSPEDFVSDDFEHPSLFIRPVIVERVMEEIKGRVNNDMLDSALSVISQRWDSFRENMISQLKDKAEMDKVNALNDEVAMVVSTILYEPYLPGEVCLLDLVDFYGKSPLSNQEILELEEMKNIGGIPLVSFSSEGEIVGPSDEDVPDNLRDLWSFIKTKLAGRAHQAEREPLKEWTALLELGLEEDHSHFFKHYSLQRHLPWGRWHRHTEGNAILWN